MKFMIYNKTANEWVPVEGELVDVAPHLVASFAVHQCPFDTSNWKVSHVATGCLIVESVWQSREEVIECARIGLAKITQQKFDEAVAKAESLMVPRPTAEASPSQGTARE